MEQGELMCNVKKIIRLMHKGKAFYNSEYCTQNTRWVIDGHLIKEEGGCDEQDFIRHKNYNICLCGDKYALIMGTYSVLSQKGVKERKEIFYHMTTLMKYTRHGIKVMGIHISENINGKEYLLESTKGSRHFMNDIDIYYLEAGHNRTLWHCGDEVIETMGNLKSKEEKLSENFVRIHRGFIVNQYHIRKVEKYYLELDNGERLGIPVKKYVDVREKIIDAKV
ncbi:MAG: LytTR family transcriptional regulator DNA-binding domain-containing protein [Lachnospiraceae bacterium]|nr:LytTR family transcriptional regulator DNA-binding domain-containing protein [Lachnospiraceae bacterium]